MLVDTVEIELKSGKGGDGVIAWRREKFVARGGPDGGDGGKGGSVILQTSHNLDTLSAFRYRKVFQAEDGQKGANKRKTGAASPDLELLVPVGTRVIDLDGGRIIVDLINDNQSYVIAKGGKGGLGNVHFVSATNQNPFEATQGQPGQSVKAKLELQLVADVALIGQPSSGKSSIIKALTGANVRIGAYHFSTTEPILGVLKSGDQSLTLVDLPGLIEGAHRGKGLGSEFLRHTQRVRVLLQVLDGTEPNIEESEQAVLSELRAYDPTLIQKPRLIVVNKTDLLSVAEQKALHKKYPDAVLVSATEQTNLDRLKDRLVEIAS